MLPHLRGFVLETDTHLVKEIGGDICLAFPAPAPKWPQMSHGWPKGSSPRAPSSYGGAFPVGPRTVSTAPYMTGLPGAVWVRVRLCAGDLECTSAVVTHGTYYVFSEARSVAPVSKLPPQFTV